MNENKPKFGIGILFLILFLILGITFVYVYFTNPQAFVEEKNVYLDGKFISNKDSFEVIVPAEPKLYKADIFDYKGKGYQSITEYGIYNIFVHEFAEVLLEKESIDIFLAHIVETKLERKEKAKLIYSKRILFKGLEAIKYTINFEHRNIPFQQKAITMIKEGRPYTLSVLYPKENVSRIESSIKTFFNSFVIK